MGCNWTWTRERAHYSCQSLCKVQCKQCMLSVRACASVPVWEKSGFIEIDLIKSEVKSKCKMAEKKVWWICLKPYNLRKAIWFYTTKFSYWLKPLSCLAKETFFFLKCFYQIIGGLGMVIVLRQKKKKQREKKNKKNNMISAPATLNSVQNKLFHSKRHLPYSGTIYQYK